MSSYALAPNPAGNDTRLVITSRENTHAHIVLYNMDGRMVFSSSVSLQNGLNAFTLPLHAVATGQYILHVKGKNISIQDKLMVMH